MKMFFYLLFGILFLITSCAKEEDITPQVQFLETGSAGFFGNCYFAFSSKNEDIVIRSEEEYSAYFADKKTSTGSCADATLPEIDFRKLSLIGKLVAGSGCSREYERRIEKTGNKTLVYYITLTETGGCLPLEMNMNWVLVPRLKNRTDVSFDVTHIRNP